MSDSASTNNTPAPATTANATENQTTQAASKPELPSVFVGNLNFQTTEGELKDFFSSAGPVKEVHIITRGPRSLGYGFVTFADQESVQKAVDTLNKTMLTGREINVEAARPMPENRGEGQMRNRPFNTRRRFNYRRGGEAGNPENGVDHKPRRARNHNLADRVESDDVIYVANLPFTTTESELADLFKDFHITDAKIPIRKHSGMSKGFGFVTLDDHDDQQAALQKFTEEPINLMGRPLSMSVAYELPATTETKEEPTEQTTESSETKTAEPAAAAEPATEASKTDASA